ncbi:MAG: metallophosphoesterase, partial [Bdellovibrionales bacterium]|nr:metallophosphoesterase [Bdellovibrionales bacterium]
MLEPQTSPLDLQSITNEKSLNNTKIRLVVSDFHLGTGRFFADGSVNILEDFLYDEEFAEFLRFYSSAIYYEREVELVLNGDILNLLQVDDFGVHTHLITERATVRAVERIIKGHPDFFSALRRFASAPRHSVAYIMGNHDAGMLWPGPRKVFERAVGARIQFYDTHYFFDGVHVEHGQQYEDLCRMDMSRPFVTSGLPEPVLNLPWGSIFVSVWLTKIKLERPHVDKVKPFTLLLRWMLIHDLVWTVKTFLRMGRFLWDTIAFRPRYLILEGVKATWGMVKQATIYPSFDHVAAQVLSSNAEARIVIFGHTHVLRYRKIEGGKEYYNEGSWN